MKVKKILNNEYIYSLTTKVICMLVSIIHSAIVARYLGASLKGSNAYISSIASVGAVVMTFGMHQAYPYFRKKYGKEKIYNDYITSICGLFLFYFIIVCFISAVLPLTAEIKISIILMPIVGFSSVIAYVAMIENPNYRNRQYLILTIVDLIFVTLLYLFTKSNFALSAIILIFSDLSKAVVYSLTIKAKIKFRKEQLSLIKEMLSFGFFPMLALLMTSLNYRVDVIMLKQYPLIVTSAQIGVYSIGMNISDKIAIVPDNLKGILASKLTKGAGTSEVAKICRFSLWSNLVICFGLIILGKPFISFLYGTEYLSAYDVMIICASGTVFIGYFKLIAQYNIINHKQIRNVAILTVSVVVNIILNSIFIPLYAEKGAAFASCVGYFLSGIIFVVWFSRANNLSITKMFFPQKEDIELIKKYLGRR